MTPKGRRERGRERERAKLQEEVSARECCETPIRSVPEIRRFKTNDASVSLESEKMRGAICRLVL